MLVRAHGWETYAFHVSTKGIPPISNFLIRRSETARLRFHHGVLAKQSHGLLRGPEERANAGRLFATDHLQVMFGPGSKRTEHRTTDVGSCLFYIRAGEGQLPAQVSSRYIISEQRHTQSLSDVLRRCLAILKKRRLAIRQGQIKECLRTFHNYLHITHKTMHNTQCLSTSGPSFILSQSIQPPKHGPDLAVS
jgi:hypothetical protein